MFSLTSVLSELRGEKRPLLSNPPVLKFKVFSVSPKKQNLWLFETKDFAYPNTEAKNRPAQPSFFPRQTGPARFDALW